MVFDWNAMKNNALLSSYQDYQKSDETGFLIFDGEGNIVSYNQTFLQITQSDTDQLKNQSMLALFNLDSSVLDILNTDSAITKTITIREGFQAQAHFCSMICAQDSARGLMIINEKAHEQEYLKDISNNLNQLKVLIDNFNIGFVILDGDHKVIEVNNTFCKSLGYTLDEALNLTAWDYIHDFQEDKKIHDFILDDTFDFRDNNYHIKKGGKMIPVRATCTIGMINGEKIALCFYENISEQVESSARLEQSESMLRNFITNSSEVIIVLNKKLEVSYLSPNTKKVFNYQKNMHREDIISHYLPLKDPEFKDFIKDKLKDKDPTGEFEYTVGGKNKHRRYFSIRTSTVKTSEKMVICYLRDTTKDKEYIQELKILSYTDQLTKLYNRKFMEEQLLDLRKPENFPLSIITADLDGLKEVNDTLGHQAGDELLKLFANILSECHHNPKELFRIGGDEFLVLATKTSERKAKNIVQAIEENIHRHNNSPSSLLKISVSVGYTTCDDYAANLSSKLAQADKEMYKIKNAKKANR